MRAGGAPAHIHRLAVGGGRGALEQRLLAERRTAAAHVAARHVDRASLSARAERARQHHCQIAAAQPRSAAACTLSRLWGVRKSISACKLSRPACVTAFLALGARCPLATDQPGGSHAAARSRPERLAPLASGSRRPVLPAPRELTATTCGVLCGAHKSLLGPQPQLEAACGSGVALRALHGPRERVW